MTTEQQEEDPRILQMYFRAMSCLTPKEQEEAVYQGTKKACEVQVEEDMSILENGFLIFSKAAPAKRKDAFLKQTMQADIFRCLLTESYLDEYKAGAPPPESPLWSTLLQVGGEHVWEYFRKEFIRAWNDTARSLTKQGAADLSHLVYER